MVSINCIYLILGLAEEAKMKLEELIGEKLKMLLPNIEEEANQENDNEAKK